jgi:predicted phage terminase large subunit-like protein
MSRTNALSKNSEESAPVVEKLSRTKFNKIINAKTAVEKERIVSRKNWARWEGPSGPSAAYAQNPDAISIEDADVYEKTILEPILDPPVLTTKEQILKQAVMNPLAVQREICKRDLGEFIKYFWDVVAHDTLYWNWHIPYICNELMQVAKNVAHSIPREYDLIINIPPGMTKSITVSVMLPIWCWTNWPWMRFICASYSAALSLEQADYSREIIRSYKFKQLFPEIAIKEDKDTKSNFRITYLDKDGVRRIGGNRYSTSVGGSLTGFHGHMLIVDDPINPKEAVSDLKLQTANQFMSQTLSTRKIDKAVTPTILIMQRLAETDPTGELLAKKKEGIKHICLPGEIMTFEQYVKPPELVSKYVNKLLDPVRMSISVLHDMETDLGQYGYAGQVGQNPVPPGGGMFHVDQFGYMNQNDIPTPQNILMTVRCWDKAGSTNSGAYTVGVKMCLCRFKTEKKFIVLDVKRGQWSAEVRERIIKQTAEADGNRVFIYQEQEPGSGGLESAQATIRNLAGFIVESDRPTGDKIFRADPYSVQVNNGNVLLLRGEWNQAFIEEHRFFPFGKFKDQCDAAALAFTKLVSKRFVRRIT